MGIELTEILYDAVDRYGYNEVFEALQKIRKYKTETPETNLHIKDDEILYVERDYGWDVTFGSDPDQLYVFDGDTIKIDSNAGPHRKIISSSDGGITIDAVYKWGGEIK